MMRVKKTNGLVVNSMNSNRYSEWRLAKRNGEIIMQKRTLIVTLKPDWKWYQFSKWGEYTRERTHNEWEDVQIPEADDERTN